MRRKHVSVMALCLIGVLCFQVCSAEDFGDEVGSVYYAVVEKFDEGYPTKELDDAYEEAMELKKLHNGEKFENAYQYIEYLEGWKAISEDRLDDARKAFDGIDFYDSEAYLTYIKGRKHQDNQEYEKALAYYEEAEKAGIRVNTKYKKDCKECLRAQKYDDAERFELNGDYLRASQIFAELAADDYRDSLTRRKTNLYEHGKQLMNFEKWQEAYEVFVELSSYKDSIDKAAVCKMKLDESSVTNTLTDLTVSPSAESAVLTWKDKLNSGEYTIEWYVGEMVSKSEKMTSQETGAVLERLIPNTRYTVCVNSNARIEERIEMEFTTPQSEGVNQFSIKTQTVYRFQKRDLERYAVSNPGKEFLMMANYRKWERLDANKVITTSGSRMSDYGIGYVLHTYFGRTEEDPEQELSFRVVFRIGEAYADMLESTVKAETTNTRINFYQDLTPLLDGLYEYVLPGDWYEGAAYIDMYINGIFAHRTAIVLGPERKN